MKDEKVQRDLYIERGACEVVALLLKVEQERSAKLETELRDTKKLLEQYKIALPIDEWHEDLGACLWWIFPLQEPPYSGTPLDCDWPEYHTHFTRLTNDMLPEPR